MRQLHSSFSAFNSSCITIVKIWEDILGFENAEFYIKKWPQLDGYRFEDALLSFPNAIPCGVKIAVDGKIVLNPSDNYVLEEGDEILVIAEDDDTYAPGSLPEVCFPPSHVNICIQLLDILNLLCH